MRCLHEDEHKKRPCSGFGSIRLGKVMKEDEAGEPNEE